MTPGDCSGHDGASHLDQRRARLPPFIRGGACGSGTYSGKGFRRKAGSSLPSAGFSGAIRGDNGNLSSEIERRTTAATAAGSSSVKSMLVMVRIMAPGWGARKAVQRGNDLRPVGCVLRPSNTLSGARRGRRLGVIVASRPRKDDTKKQRHTDTGYDAVLQTVIEWDILRVCAERRCRHCHGNEPKTMQPIRDLEHCRIGWNR
jgi:hypothetical protein